MQKRMILWLALPCVCVVAAMQNSNEPTYDREAVEKAVLEANSRMTQASNSLDVDKFFAFILDSDRGLIIQDGVLFKTRQEAYEAVKQGFQGISKLDRVYDQTYVTVLSPDMALLTGTGKTTATLSDGGTFTGPFAASMVFVQKDGRWKMLQGHYSTPNP